MPPNPPPSICVFALFRAGGTLSGGSAMEVRAETVRVRRRCHGRVYGNMARAAEVPGIPV